MRPSAPPPIPADAWAKSNLPSWLIEYLRWIGYQLGAFGESEFDTDSGTSDILSGEVAPPPFGEIDVVASPERDLSAAVVEEMRAEIRQLRDDIDSLSLIHISEPTRPY